MTKPNKDTFSTGLEELESITTWFESEHADLDEGLVKFERGMQLIGELRGQLSAVENRVEKIKAKFDTGSTEGETKPEAPDADSAHSLSPDASSRPELF